MIQLTLVPVGWYSMEAAPKNCTHIDLLMADKQVIRDAHWASDLSGEEQPPFEGWFVKVSESLYRQVDGDHPTQQPVGWRPVERLTK